MPRLTTGRSSTAEFYTAHSYGSDRERYAQLLRRARGFFAANSDRRYSPSSLDRIGLAATAAEIHGEGGVGWMPMLAVVEEPFAYDPDTESKSGGIQGMAVCWPGDKTLICVKPSSREQGIGKRLITTLNRQMGIGALVLWVGRENLPGHHFALRSGLYPSAMNSAGAVRYDSGDSDV